MVRVGVVCLWVVLAPFVASAQVDLLTLVKSINPDCTRFRVTGVCICGFDTPCVTVEYWEPLYVVETVKITGKSVLGGSVLGAFSGSSGLFGQLTGLFGMAGLGGGGAANAGTSGQTNLFYNEARVYRLPPLPDFVCGACRNGPAFAMHYVSDIDKLWRTSTASALLPSIPFLNPLGVWAPLYPRIGFTIHGSEPVASVASATHALHIANFPITGPPHPEVRPVIFPADEMSTCFQPAWPTMKGCFPTGTHPAFWENGMPSPTGEYLWIYWVKRKCCVRPEQAVCRAAVGGVSGAQNYCPLPINALGVLAGAAAIGVLPIILADDDNETNDSDENNNSNDTNDDGDSQAPPTPQPSEPAPPPFVPPSVCPGDGPPRTFGPQQEAPTTAGQRITAGARLSTVVTRPGTYLLEAGIYTLAGNWTVPAGVTLKPYNGATVTIQTSGVVALSSNSTFAGLALLSSGPNGVAVVGDNVTVRNSTVRARARAIAISGDNARITGNDIATPPGRGRPGSTLSARTNGRGARNVFIAQNFVHDCNEDCIQTENTGGFRILNNLVQGDAAENLLDIKDNLPGSPLSTIAGNHFACSSIRAGSGCVILHGAQQTNAVVSFENNTLDGCPARQDKLLQVNGKPGVNNVYHVRNNLFNGGATCRAMNVTTCRGCAFSGNRGNSRQIQNNGPTLASNGACR